MASVDNDLEEVMAHLGEFGKYQAWQFALHIIAALTAGLHMLTLVTVAATPEHQCQVPRLDFNETTQNLWAPKALGKCNYLNEFNVTLPCDSWTYDRTYHESSRGMEWNFVCSRRWMGSLAQSSYMFGVFIGAVTLGSMADKYGRKIIFYVSSIAQLVLGVGVALVPEYYAFLVVRFLYGIFGSAGAYITGFVLSMELVGASRRTACGIMFQLSFAIGIMLVAGWGALIKDRMWLQIVYGLHGAFLLGHWWLMDESPRWLWGQGRINEALEILQRALRMNGSDVILDVNRFTAKSKSDAENDQDSRDNVNTYGATDLFKTPNLRKKSLNVCLNWFANSLVYYGLSLNSGNLVGNPFLMLFLSGLVEVPSYIFTICVLDKTGRRSLTSTLMLIGGVCCIIATFIPEGDKSTKAAVVLFGKACIAGSFAIIYNYTAELFPTVLRNTALGIGSMCARASGTLTPMIFLLDSFDPKAPAILFGFIALLSGFLTLYLPETVNQPMPESLEDGENFGKGDTCFSTCFNRRGDKRSYEIALQQSNDNNKEKSNNV